MSKRLREMVKTLQAKKDWTMEEVAASIGYSRGHLSRLINDPANSEAEDELLSKFSNLLQNVTSPTPVIEGMTMEQILATIIKANRDYAEGFKTLAKVVERLEKNMARQDSQARIETNLNEALAGIETLSGDSEKIMADLEVLKARRNDSSGDVGNK